MSRTNPNPKVAWPHRKKKNGEKLTNPSDLRRFAATAPPSHSLEDPSSYLATQPPPSSLIRALDMIDNSRNGVHATRGVAHRGGKKKGVGTELKSTIVLDSLCASVVARASSGLESRLRRHTEQRRAAEAEDEQV